MNLTLAQKPFVLGTVRELSSKILNETRTLNIYLPEGYNENDTARYPVVYLLDGSADEDFIHVVGLYQFNSFSWIDRVPPSIVVGIATIDRKRDYTFPSSNAEDKKLLPSSGGSQKFIQFIEKELQPHIEQTFRTNKHRTLIGQSLGGLLATEILLTKPQLFEDYIIISPSLWWDNGSLLDIGSAVYRREFDLPLHIYLGVGKEGVTPGKNPRVMEVDCNLLAEKLRHSKSKSVQIFFDYLPEEDHATIGHQAVFNALRLLHPKPIKKE
ncbi:MAG TPA: alpha/beta hydrolase-fold protein [Flavipsychrobacter sp.]|nr:alpha/beta hydrolase-fold protein [Flavipsychrobacter sp.]